ncbi:MAG: 16S rRNA (guanine(966)-N(2))-methyltransferase RsmD [Anaerolineae bacterium]
MRVIAGSAKGRRLEAVPGATTRPITDRTKEALFNILGSWLAGARLLDLFAGTGAVGIEALSRGAAFVLFVDKAGPALKTIHHNLRHTGLAGRARVLRGDAFKILARPVDEPFDLVYIAPPQYAGLWARALHTLDAHIDLLAGDGIAIAQIHPKEFEDLPLRHLSLYRRRTYGSTQLCFYERI